MFLIIGIAPINNEMNVPVSADIEILFSKAVDSITVDPNTVYLQDTTTGTRITAALQYVSSDMKIVINPSAPLEGGRKYRTYIVGGNIGIMAADGELLAATAYYEFTTEPGAYEPTTPPAEEPTVPSETSVLFEVSATYPQNGTIHVKPAFIKVLFTNALDAATVSHENVYLVQRRFPKALGIMDLMTDYNPAHNVLNSVANPITLENGNSMLSIQINEGDLADNTDYTLIIRGNISDGTSTLGVPFASSFHTTISPLYVEPDMLRDEMKAFLINVPDIAMYRRIYDASIEARDVVLARDQNMNLLASVPYYVQQYVKHKATYELAVNAVLQDSKTSGSNRSLGDLTVSKDSAQTDMTKLLRELKDRIKPWLDQLHGRTNRGYASPGVVVRGENIETYPDHLARIDFTDLGG